MTNYTFIFKIEKIANGLWSYTIMKDWGIGIADEVDYTTTTSKKKAIHEATSIVNELNNIH
jgi:hypothetical protein